MRVIRVRMLIFLILLYAAILFIIYEVWHSRSNDTGGIFNSPGKDDLPRLGNDIVQFNFKRRNGPPLMESNDTFDAFFNSSYVGDESANSSVVVPSIQNPVLDRPNVLGHGNRHLVKNEHTNSSLEDGEHTSHLSKHAQNGLNTMYDVSHLDPPNYCIHAFYYMWYGNPEFDGQYLHWNHRYLPHWEQSVTNQHPKGRHVPPDDIGASFYPGS